MPTRKLKSPKFVEVVWADIVAESKWVKAENLPYPAHFVTRGWLVKKTKKFIVLAATMELDVEEHVRDYGETIAIPVGVIREVKVLNG